MDLESAGEGMAERAEIGFAGELSLSCVSAWKWSPYAESMATRSCGSPCCLNGCHTMDSAAAGMKESFETRL